MSAHTPGPWVIDDRSIYEGQHGLGMQPTQLGAVVAECPTAFGTHTVRAPSTIGKPCPTKAELDAQGLANAHLVKAAPDLLAASKTALEAFAQFATEEPAEEWTAVAMLRAAIAKAQGA